MPKVSDDYRAAQRARIADSALRVFAHKGFQGTSMSDIITESGMSAGAIYAYFPGKADIIAEVAGRVLVSRIDNIEQLATQKTMPPPGGLIRAILRGLRDELGSPSIVLQVWAEAVSDPQLRAMASRGFDNLLTSFRHYLSAWHRHTHNLQPKEADALAREQAPLLLSACQGYLVQLAIMDNFDSDFYLEHVVARLPH